MYGQETRGPIPRRQHTGPGSEEAHRRALGRRRTPTQDARPRGGSGARGGGRRRPGQDGLDRQRLLGQAELLEFLGLGVQGFGRRVLGGRRLGDRCPGFTWLLRIHHLQHPPDEQDQRDIRDVTSLDLVVDGGQDAHTSVIQTSDGGYAIVGDTRSFGAGSYDCWLVKTDVNGFVQWNRTYGGINGDYGHHITETSDGGYAITGVTTSFGAGFNDAWLIKTEIESGLAWTDSTVDTITLYRGATDSYWNYLRIRIWRIKENP